MIDKKWPGVVAEIEKFVNSKENKFGRIGSRFKILQMQQTPYPAAQVPELVPPNCVHSVEL